MKDSVKVAFASGTPELNRQFIDALAGIYPDLPLYVVSEFAPHQGQWVPYHPRQGFLENYRRCRTRFRDKHIRLAAAVLVPRVPYRRMRLLALLLSPVGFLAFNENLNNFMLRPRSLRAIASHCLWRIRNAVRAQSLPGGLVYRMRELSRNRQLRKIEFAYGRARMFGLLSSAARALPLRRDLSSLSGLALENGISVVIPSRNGRELLQSLLPRLQRELTGIMSEVLVIDNGSDDGTAAWLHSCEPSVTVDEVPEPLSYARAVNRGLARARYSRTMLLNNDMSLGPGFFAPLVQAFMEVPDLFCATAQIFFPPGVRREETGKAVLRQTEPTAFPVRYDDPLPGENCTYVLYGSGGCSLYDTAKLRALSGFSEVYDPAYVEDLDAGYRAWLYIS